jgi:hypothetical protein
MLYLHDKKLVSLSFLVQSLRESEDKEEEGSVDMVGKRQAVLVEETELLGNTGGD